MHQPIRTIRLAMLTATLAGAPAIALADPHAQVDTTTKMRGFHPPKLIEKTDPAYTEAALIAKIEGTIELQIAINALGEIENVNVTRGLGYGLDEASLEAAKNIRFAPATFDGIPVPCTVNYHFHFTLPKTTEATPEPTPAATPEATPAAPAPKSAGMIEQKVETPNFAITVRGRRPITAASSMTIRARDFMLRPHPRPADILATTPGLQVVQHAGGGKANQYFMRGFDVDHGTDVAFSVDGVPVNMVSHGHGQGYTDFNWLIPEIVERIEVEKGPYYVENGDFATAGAINVITRRKVEKSAFTLTGGSFETLRSLFVASPEVGNIRSLVAAEAYTTNGPFQSDEELRRYSAFGRATTALSSHSTLALSAMSYAAGWNASGQIPTREVLAGRLDRFGSLDPTEGGKTQHHGAQLSYEWRGEGGDNFEAIAYVGHHRFQLFSNFTFFSADAENGDMIEQGDNRTMFGAKGAYSFFNSAGDITFETTFGLQSRNDVIDNALHRDVERRRIGTSADAGVFQASIGAYAREEITWTSWLRTVAGVRADHFAYSVDDRLDDAASKSASATLVSPKASLIISPLDDTDLFLNFGYGFHSNDARGVVQAEDSVTPLTRAVGYELGARTKLFDRLDLAASVFRLDLDSEIVWVGDEGTTESSGATRRMGLETEARLKILPWLFADLDMTWSDGQYTDLPDSENAIALAPRFAMAGGLSAQHEDGFYGRIGALRIADRPATEDRFLTAKGFTRVDATAGYRTDSFELSISVQNVLDEEYEEAQFATTSRLKNETSCPAGTRAVEDGGSFLGCEDVNFTPGAPLNAQATATLYF